MAIRFSAVASSLVLCVLAVWCVGLSVGQSQVVDATGSCTTTFYPSSDGYYGGDGGDAFSDAQNPYTCGSQYPTSITGWYGRYLDALDTVYAPNGLGHLNGGTSGDNQQIPLPAGVYISAVAVYGDKYVDKLVLTTTQGNTYTWGGDGGSLLYQSNWASGQYLSYFEGRGASYIDALRIVTFQVNA